MPTTTTTYSFNKPTVGGDEDAWGGYLNGNWDSIDDILDGTTPVTGIDINSGSIDGTAIGANSASTGSFTTMTVSSTFTLGGTAVTSTAAELNILDGVTSTTAELNILDGVTATAAELNILDGVTATAAELNYNDITTLGTSEASKAVTADANGDVTLAAELKATSYNESYVSLSGTTPSVDCEAGNVFALSTTGNTTFTFSNPPASGTAFGFVLRLTAGGSHTISWPSSVDWPAATAPDAPASGETDILTFFTTDGGTTWYGNRAIDAAG
jgi:hypothetical protein